MTGKEVRLEKMTRREFRGALEAGHFNACVLPTGAIEQHLEHLAMEHDIRSSTWVAEEAARRLYPRVVVAQPLRVGISEHHMAHRFGTITVKPGTFHSAVWDACDSWIRHGIMDVLILNGHGGNIAPMLGSVNQFRRYWLDASIYFHSYWDFVPKDVSDKVLVTQSVPGHAQEYETSLALHMFPDDVRQDLIPVSDDEGVRASTADKGAVIYEATMDRLVKHVRGMADGRLKAEIDGL